MVADGTAVLNGVGNGSRVLESGALAAAGCSGELGGEGRKQGVVEEGLGTVNTGTGDNPQVLDRFNLYIGATNQTVTVRGTLGVLILVFRIDSAGINGELFLVNTTRDRVDSRVQRVQDHGQTTGQVVVATGVGTVTPVSVVVAAVVGEVHVQANL